MARIVFTATEKANIEAVLEELEPTVHELTSQYAERLTAQEWAFVAGYIRKELQSFVEIKTMIRAVAEAALARGMADEEGVADFLESRTWVRNFDVADDDDALFMTIASSTGRPGPGLSYDLAADADALLELADERLRGSLDDEYRELVRRLKA